jgi:hypothetical protein
MGGAIHVRAATIPSPVLGLEKGDRESFGLAGLYMGQVRHMFFRAQVQEPESPTHNDVWYGVFERSVRAVWLLWSFPRRLILLISSRSLELRLSLYLSLSLSLSRGQILSDLGYRVARHGGVSRWIKVGWSAQPRDRTERDDK